MLILLVADLEKLMLTSEMQLTERSVVTTQAKSTVWLESESRIIRAADNTRRAVRENAVKRPSVPVAAARKISGDGDREVYTSHF
jgi:hypothetical protein